MPFFKHVFANKYTFYQNLQNQNDLFVTSPKSNFKLQSSPKSLSNLASRLSTAHTGQSGTAREDNVVQYMTNP